MSMYYVFKSTARLAASTPMATVERTKAREPLLMFGFPPPSPPDRSDAPMRRPEFLTYQQGERNMNSPA